MHESEKIPRTAKEIQELTERLPPAPMPSRQEIEALKAEHGALYMQRNELGGVFLFRVPTPSACSGSIQALGPKEKKKKKSDDPLIKLAKTHTVYPEDAQRRYTERPGIGDAFAATFVRQLGMNAGITPVEEDELTDEEADALNKNFGRAQCLEIVLDEDGDPVRVVIQEPGAAQLKRLNANLFGNFDATLDLLEELTVTGDLREALVDYPFGIFAIANYLQEMTGQKENSDAKKL